MGIGGISIWQLLIILLIVVMIFGTKRLKNIGSDLGGAVKGFKDSITEEDEKASIESAKAESAESESKQTESSSSNSSN